MYMGDRSGRPITYPLHRLASVESCVWTTSQTVAAVRPPYYLGT